MMRAAPPAVDRLHAWIERCQMAAAPPVDAAEAAAVAAACGALVRMATAVPSGLSTAQQQIVRRVLNEAWARVLRLVVPAAASPDGDQRGAAAPRPSVVGDRRAERLLAEIDRRYADPRLTLTAVARQLAVSPSHLTQILKAASGRTFGAHVHVRRVAEARRLLAESTLSVKEIASRVGYATTTQLDRHFRKIVQRPPTVYRGAQRRAREE